MIPLLQTKSADTAHMGSMTRPFSHFWAGPGDGANSICDEEVEWNRDVCTWEDYSKYVHNREALQYSEAVYVGFVQLHFTGLLFETVCFDFISNLMGCLNFPSLVPTPCAPPGEKRSGERSRISWASGRFSDSVT